MNCIVTAGPTYEPLDQVRRLTNFSTGRLGIELGNHLAARGHDVTLLVGEQATWSGERRVQREQHFGTTAHLRAQLAKLAGENVRAVFHAAAVSDFAIGKIWSRSASGQLTELNAGKISSSHESLLVELRPTPKIIAHLRDWFPRARLVGWKYEVEGSREAALTKARRQIQENHTDACVANGPAYGPGFGLITSAAEPLHLADHESLFAALIHWVET